MPLAHAVHALVPPLLYVPLSHRKQSVGPSYDIDEVNILVMLEKSITVSTTPYLPAGHDTQFPASFLTNPVLQTYAHSSLTQSEIFKLLISCSPQLF